MANSNSKGILAIILILVLGVIAWGVLTMPDQRSTGDKIGDAVDALPQGIDKAAQQLEDRTPGEKLGDEIKDATDR